jgi:toxin ParE1/3/4
MLKIPKVIEWRPSARKDLFEIIKYIGKDSSFTAQIFSEKIKEKISVLSEHPELGRMGVVNGTRELVIHSNYVIIYEIRVAKIEIVRIKHAARTYETF